MDVKLDSSRPVKHVDRRELYTNLEARVSYLQSFLDFNSSDVEALASGAKYIKALIPAVVNIVYKKLLETDITARAFHTRNTMDETPLDEYLHEESPQIQRRKMFLRWYLIKICSDPTQMDFWSYLDKVGLMHCGRGRMNPLNIEYMHVGICLGFIQDVFTEALMSHPRLPLRRKVDLVRAIGKVIWIQNDLFAKWYVRDGEEFADETPVINADKNADKEGYLGDKRMLGESSPLSGNSSEDDQSSVNSCPAEPKTGTCPFSGSESATAVV